MRNNDVFEDPSFNSRHKSLISHEKGDHVSLRIMDFCRKYTAWIELCFNTTVMWNGLQTKIRFNCNDYQFRSTFHSEFPQNPNTSTRAFKTQKLSSLFLIFLSNYPLYNFTRSKPAKRPLCSHESTQLNFSKSRVYVQQKRPLEKMFGANSLKEGALPGEDALSQ